MLSLCLCRVSLRSPPIPVPVDLSFCFPVGRSDPLSDRRSLAGRSDHGLGLPVLPLSQPLVVRTNEPTVWLTDTARSQQHRYWPRGVRRLFSSTCLLVRLSAISYLRLTQPLARPRDCCRVRAARYSAGSRMGFSSEAGCEHWSTSFRARLVTRVTHSFLQSRRLRKSGFDWATRVCREAAVAVVVVAATSQVIATMKATSFVGWSASGPSCFCQFWTGSAHVEERIITASPPGPAHRAGGRASGPAAAEQQVRDF